jgi:hypothetical protein
MTLKIQVLVGDRQMFTELIMTPYFAHGKISNKLWSPKKYFFIYIFIK